MKSAFHALGIKQGLKIYLTVCHVILHVFKHHRKDESTRVGLYVSAGAILFFLHILLQNLVKKNKHRRNTTLSRPTNLLKSTHFCQNTGPLRRYLFLVPDCIQIIFFHYNTTPNARNGYQPRVSSKGALHSYRLHRKLYLRAYIRKLDRLFSSLTCSLCSVLS